MWMKNILWWRVDLRRHAYAVMSYIAINNIYWWLPISDWKERMSLVWAGASCGASINEGHILRNWITDYCQQNLCWYDRTTTQWQPLNYISQYNLGLIYFMAYISSLQYDMPWFQQNVQFQMSSTRKINMRSSSSVDMTDTNIAVSIITEILPQ